MLARLNASRGFSVTGAPSFGGSVRGERRPSFPGGFLITSALGFSVYHTKDNNSTNYVECVTLCSYNNSVGYPTSNKSKFVTSSSVAYIVFHCYKPISTVEFKVSLATSLCQGVYIDPCAISGDKFDKNVGIKMEVQKIPLTII